MKIEDHPEVKPILARLKNELGDVARAMARDKGKAKDVLNEYRERVPFPVTFQSLSAASGIEVGRLADLYFQHGTRDDYSKAGSWPQAVSWPQASLNTAVILMLADKLADDAETKRLQRHAAMLVDRLDVTSDEVERLKAENGTIRVQNQKLEEEVEVMRHKLGLSNARRDDLADELERLKAEKGTVEDHERVVWHDEPEPTFWDRVRGFFRGVFR